MIKNFKNGNKNSWIESKIQIKNKKSKTKDLLKHH